tara:strand:+ start:392 stop:1075 length:684 start_codon:yes stop_codon:yes gene_type:complete
MTLSTLEMNYVNLTPSQKAYFEHLAADSNNSEPIDYFEKVPADLRSDPTMVEQYLNGDPELGTADRDWSHVESKANGGSNEADNGFFEDQSVNRSRGADNTTAEEVYEAAEESEEDTQTILEAAQDVGDFTSWAFAVEAAASVGDLAMDALAPVVGGALAGKAVADRCTTTQDKLGYGSMASGAAVAFLVTPVGQACVAGYVGYKLLKRGSKLYNRHFSTAPIPPGV